MNSAESPVHASIPVRRDPAVESAVPAIDGWLLAFILAAVALGLATLVLRRRMRPAKPTEPWWTRMHSVFEPKPSHAVQRLSSTRLTPRHSLHVVVWDGRRMLVGCSDRSIQLLAEENGMAALVKAPE